MSWNDVERLRDERDTWLQRAEEAEEVAGSLRAEVERRDAALREARLHVVHHEFKPCGLPHHCENSRYTAVAFIDAALATDERGSGD